MNLGKINTTYRKERSFNGLNISVLKSGIQKYLRRGNFEKGIWCLVELDLFSLIEEQPETPENKKDRQAAIRIRSNMINRLVCMMTEEISISCWWIPIKMLELYQYWIKYRTEKESRMYLLKMYYMLIQPKKIRLISDLRSVFLLPSDYLDNLEDLKQIHQQVISKYPDVLSMNYGSDKEITDKDQIFLNICQLMEDEKDEVFYWTQLLIRLDKKFSNKLWNYLVNYYQAEETKQRKQVIVCLHSFFKIMTHKEKWIYLYHAILLISRRSQINWSEKMPEFIDNRPMITDLVYQDNKKGLQIELDDFILDIHTTHNNKYKEHPLSDFALIGAHVENENERLLNPIYREIYIELKKQLDLYHHYKPNKLDQLLKILPIPIVEINDTTIIGPQAQKKTSAAKKCVYIVNDLAIKGPYLPSDQKLMYNLQFTQALMLIEDELQLEEKYRTTLPWKELWKTSKGEYYLIADNIGDHQKLETEKVTTKLETNVEVIKRGTFVKRVSELEEPHGEIKIASLQHLYLRYLLDIGDSGTHNILVREDQTERFVVGNDLEEKRKIKDTQHKLELLFKKISKKDKILYQDFVDKIQILNQLSSNLKDKLESLEIDTNTVVERIEKWL